MFPYEVGYSGSYAIIIETQIRNTKPNTEQLANILQRFPYNFSITQLIGAEATCAILRNTLEKLYTIDTNARIIIYIADQPLKHTDGTVYIGCIDADAGNLHEDAISYVELLTLPRKTRASILHLS